MLIDRRHALLGLSTAAVAAACPAWAAPQNAWPFFFAGLSGDEIKLGAFQGKPVMVVNTASRCGFVGQFAGLQQLWTRFGTRGLTVVGVPSNDFGGQEPGGVAEIEDTSHGYGVSFPLAAKTPVVGLAAHPFYRWAAAERPGETPRWNFHKYLIGRDGRIAAVFPTGVEPTDSRVIAAIVKELPTA